MMYIIKAFHTETPGSTKYALQPTVTCPNIPAAQRNRILLACEMNTRDEGRISYHFMENFLYITFC